MESILQQIKNSDKSLLSVKEAAILLGVHPMTLRKYMKWGGLKYTQPVRKIFINPDDLADFLIKYKKTKRELISQT